MTNVTKGDNRIAALEAELARVQAERALMDARIRSATVELPAQGARRADVLAWGAFFVAAALVASLVVVLAQKAPVVHERTRVETVIVPEIAPAAPVAVAEPAAPVVPSTQPRATEGRPRTPRTPTLGMTPTLLDDDRCGSDPTCGI